MGLPLPFAAAQPGPPAATAADDPILALAHDGVALAPFRMAVAAAVRRHPSLDEAAAQDAQARAARAEARAGLLPTVDVQANSQRVFARDFSSDSPATVYDRLRAYSRTDLTLSATETLFDFGATSQRIAAAGARLRAAALGIDVAADQVALRMIAAWYDVFTYRALLALAEAHVRRQQALRGDVQARVDRGYSASGDLVRVDSALAATGARAAGYRRQLANAEARFAELAGNPPPAGLGRAPPPGPMLASMDAARAAADRAPGVRAAAEQATGARADARAAGADRLPVLSVGLDTGRYGVFEGRGDYDVRGQFTVRQRFSGALIARARQVGARSSEAEARARRVREEAERDAAIAWSDVAALDEQVRALEASYVAGRDSRAMLAERFRLARGTLFDVLAADDAEFGTAAAYVEALGERDAARYALLSRTGRLLDALEIDTSALGGGAR